MSELALDGAEERILALLAVAYGKAIAPSVLGNIHRASAAWSRGETALALVHLARTRLPKLPEGDEAPFRLFAADRVLAAGVAPRELLKACGLDVGPLDLWKAGYNPDEPRVPAGNPDGGQWTSEGDSAGDSRSGSSKLPRDEAFDSGEGGNQQSTKILHGYATVYADRFNGRLTSTGDTFDQSKLTGAVLPGTIPLRSVVTVTLDSDPSRSVDVYVNDYGLYRIITHPNGARSRQPYPGRVIDLSKAAFKALTGTNYGKVMVAARVKSWPTR